MSEWTKPGTATAVSVEITVTIPVSGQAADVTGRALAVAYDAAGEVVYKRGVGDATLKALLTAQRKSQLAGIMTKLHQAAVAQLLND